MSASASSALRAGGVAEMCSYGGRSAAPNLALVVLFRAVLMAWATSAVRSSP